MNSITRIISHALVASLMVFLAACSESGDGVLYKDDLPTAEAPAAPTPDPGPGNIVEVATEAGSFPTLLAAVEAAGLVDALSDSSASLTVFAPTEEAFAALPEGTLDALLADPDALAGVLTYHVLGSSVSASAALDIAPSTVETLNGAKVAVTTSDENLFVNFAQVVNYDIEASNGVIHVIDSVLLPPDLTPSELTIAEIAAADENFETLVAAATAANLVGTLNDPEASLTVFAPTDAAFEALGESTLNYLLNNLDDLESTLLYHVIAGAEVTSIDAIAAAGTSLEMANLDEAMISLGDAGLIINSSNIIVTDIVASNGIIHVIDTVLSAPSVAAAPLAVTLASNGSFTALSQAVEDAGLTDALMDPNANLTIFAPTDDAFSQLNEMKVSALVKRAARSVSADFTASVFDGTTVDVATETYEFPSAAASWAGFANSADIYPLTFENGGTITFTASAANPTNVFFRFEDLPYPNVGVAFDSPTVLVNSETATEYSVEIPAQGTQTFASFLMYLVERDQPVTITDVVVSSKEPVDEAFINLLKYHVYGDTVLAGDAIALAGSTIEMLNGDIAALSVDGDDNLLINSSRVITADIVTSNGVIHAINKVLSLPGEPTSVIADFTTGTFDGTQVDVETETYTFPDGAASYAGFANNADIYPLSFPVVGSITFTASAATPTNVYFRFERLPYPDTEPSYNTAYVLVDSDTPSEYTVQIPSQGVNEFSSLLMYVVERDQPVTVTNVVVTSGVPADPEPSPLAGTWTLSSEPGAWGVGPAEFSIEYYSDNVPGVRTDRACFFDDEFVFGADGSFTNVQQGSTWVENWQSGAPDACGTPVAPHDGSIAATFEYDEANNSLTLSGVGAHIGLPKAVNGAEITSPADAPASITYNAYLNDDGTLDVTINVGGNWWNFILERKAEAEPSPLAGTWTLSSEPGAWGVGPAEFSIEYYSDNVPGVRTDRACFFDDEFVFGADGSFTNVQQGSTWVEGWQSGIADACGTPVAPHDGSIAATFEYDEANNSLTLSGVGAHIGLPKAVNGAEITSPADAPESITYNAYLNDDGTLDVTINVGGNWWNFILEKTSS